jgi:hypothetical protein
MRFFFIFIVVFSVSALSEPIGDFAPDQVGNMWKYQVDIEAGIGSLFNPIRGGHFTRIIKLVKSEPIQDYTRIIFDVTDSGIDSSWYDSVIAIKKHYSDTSFQFGDSIKITLSSPDLTLFMPLFKNHLVDAKDSGMKKVLYKNDSLFQYTFSYFTYFGIHDLQYIQNIGLESLWGGEPGVSSFCYFSVKLISCTIVSSFVTQSPQKYHPVQAARQNVPNSYIFDLQGRRFQSRSLSAFPPGLMINRGVNYLQMK